MRNLYLTRTAFLAECRRNARPQQSIGKMNNFIVQNRTSIKWLLNDLPTSSDASDGIYSPEFLIPAVNASSKLVSVRWQLQLHWSSPSGGMTVCLRSVIDSEVTATLEICLYKENIMLGHGRVDGKLKKDENCALDFNLVGSLWIHGASDLKQLLMICTISNVNIEATGVVGDADVRQSKHTDHYESLLESGQFGDVVFNVGDKSMHLHKAILTSASDVFRAMFDHEMREQKENVVNVVDVDFSVMKEMLRYIYTGRVNGIGKIAAELFVVADRYAVEGLRELCENKLVDELSIDNALSRLELAVKYDMVQLKPKVLDFVVRNMKELVLKELSTDCKDELLNYISTKTISDPCP